MKKFIFAVMGVSLVAAACNSQPATPAPAPTPTPDSQSQVYETNNLKVTVPTGWTATEAAGNLAAVNVTKGNYILYINTQASQASGVEGGRFAEIAQGSPSADAVVTEQPSPPCGTSVTSTGTTDHPRMDLYVDNTEKDAYCHTPTNGKTVWYFSYITNASNSYFNYYTGTEGKGYVVTMSYNSKDVDSFPEKGSADLNSALTDMTSIVQSLEIKIK